MNARSSHDTLKSIRELLKRSRGWFESQHSIYTMHDFISCDSGVSKELF